MKKRIAVGLFCILLLCVSALPVQAGTGEAFAVLFPPTQYYGKLKQTGERVRILEAEDGKHFILLTEEGARKRVDWEEVLPYPVSSPALEAVDGKTVSYFAGAMGMKSDTGVLLWVDLARLRVYLLEYGDEGWSTLDAFPCTVGDAYHPTPTGEFIIDYKCTCIGKENLYLCRHAMCFYGSYMLHSVLYDWGGESIIDGRLNERASHGCIRLSPEHSRFLYHAVPVGSTVLIR